MTVPEQRLTTEMMERRVPLHRRTGLTVVADSERRRLDERGNRVRPSISVVIPALDEELNLPRVLEQIPNIVDEVVVVDGNSSDRTVAVALEAMPDARIVKQPGRGKGDALRAGFSASRGDAIVMLDGDGSMSPSEIPDFLDALISGAEYAKGSRFLPQAGSDDINALRWVGAHGLRMIFNWLYGAGHTDLCYGYAAFWRRTLDYLTIDRDGFEVETILAIRTAQAGLRVSEVPSFEYPRTYGSSNLRVVRDGLSILWVMLAERVRARGDVALRPSFEPAKSEHVVYLGS